MLPDEPGGYAGFNGLFGAAYANQVIDQPGGFQSSTADTDGTNHAFNDLPPAVNDVFDFSHTSTPSTCTLAPDATPCPATQAVGSGGINGFPNNFNPSAAQTLGYVAAMQESKDPTSFTVLLEDSAALSGLVIAFIGVFLGNEFGVPYFDGIASILIGVLLCGVTVRRVRMRCCQRLFAPSNPSSWDITSFNVSPPNCRILR